MIVKICGIADERTALAAAAAGADMVGFVFAPSRRRVTPERARAIIAALREHHGRNAVQAVGVFVAECPHFVDDVAAYCGLDLVQLSGDEDVGYLRRLATPAIVARRVSANTRPEAVLASAPQGPLLLLDALSPGARGGTGSVCDWGIAGQIASRRSVILAGGLTPQNVGVAIAAVRPWGVDVSSGVESEGRKDPLKIAAFVRKAKEECLCLSIKN